MCKCDKNNPETTCDKCIGGRPPLYSDPEEFAAKVDRYFEERDKQDRPYLFTGLALYLGMVTETLRDYGRKPDFSCIVKRAKERVSADLQERAIIHRDQATGCIFNLKCNHDMIEKSKLELSGDKEAPIQHNVKIEAEVRAALEKFEEDY